MNKLPEKVAAFSRKQQLLSKNDRLLAGFSGGTDSTALMSVLLKLRDKLNLEISAAHINYNLRGEDSIADREFVKHFCQSKDIPLYIKEVSLQGSDIENRARIIRFDFFEELTAQHGIAKIVLGHNQDDAAETLLLHLLRGTGISGMRGILPCNGKIIRPLLACSRQEIRAYLTAEQLAWREDMSNYEPSYTRNKIRNELIPYLGRDFNPNISELLFNSSVIFQETDSYLRKQSLPAWEEALINSKPGEIKLAIPVLSRYDRIISFYLLNRAVEATAGYSLLNSQFNDIISCWESSGSKEITLSANVMVRIEYDVLTVVKLTDSREDSQQEIRLNLDGIPTQIGNSIITCKLFSVAEADFIRESAANCVFIAQEKVRLPLTAGFRTAGERFVPLGMTGSKKLKEFFIDEKISKFERDNVIIVRDAEKVVWVAGLRLDNRVAVSPETRDIIRIEITAKKSV